MWVKTLDTWHVKRDTFWGVNILSKFKLPSYSYLWFMILWRSVGKGSLNQSVNHEAIYWTAPATPDLLKIVMYWSQSKNLDLNWMDCRWSSPEKGENFTDSASSTPEFMFEYTHPSLRGEVCSSMNLGVLELKLHEVQCCHNTSINESWPANTGF